MKTERTGAFSDGVFSIAATLLVLDIHRPDPASVHIWADLAAGWPAYLGYVVSFATLGILWINHHAFLDALAGVDRTVLFLNLLLLLVVGLVPFPTALLSDAYRVGANERAASIIYAATWLAAAILFTCSWWYVVRRSPGLLRISETAASERLGRSLAGPVAYAVALAAAVVWPPLALGLFVLTAAYFAHPGRQVAVPADSANPASANSRQGASS